MKRKGPWTIKENKTSADFSLLILCNDKSQVAAVTDRYVQLPKQEAIEQTKANAALIAAAPDMFEALIAAKYLYEKLEFSGMCQGIYDGICAALEKAKTAL